MNALLKLPESMTTLVRGVVCGILGLIAVLLPVNHASAQNNANADAAYNGWLSAYMIQSGGSTYFARSLTDRSSLGMWGTAYLITGVEDAYNRSNSPVTLALITNLLNTFESKNSADLSGDSWNDDVAWATIALIRGYHITGNAALLSDAEQAWNMAYNRGWDSTYGGGIWENMDNVPGGGKDGLSNWPFVISGCLIYQYTGDSTYLTKCQAIYDWSRSHCFDTNSGRVYEGWGPTGQKGDDNAYNSGLIVNAANSLYQITGTVQYFNDAQLAANHVTNKYAVLNEDHVSNGDFGGDQFYRGLSLFALQNNLWSSYQPWLENNCTAAWNHRRTDYNITWNKFTSNTPSGTNNIDSQEAEGGTVVQSATQISSTGVLANGTYQIVNRNSGLAVDSKGTQITNGTPVQQYAYHGGANQQWTLTYLGDGKYKIIGVQSGSGLSVDGWGTANGTGIEIYTNTATLNQLWSLTATSGGYCRLTPANAPGSALDVQHSGTTNSIPLQIWSYNGGNSQQWSFQTP
jgi:Glycosyl hydrolase family 76/Ricin-type beta-trefoil lectin domain-like